MPWNVGDKVLIRRNLRKETLVEDRVGLGGEMERYEGQAATISRVRMRGYGDEAYQICDIEEDNGRFVWSEDCFEPITEEGKLRYLREKEENDKYLAAAERAKKGILVYSFSKNSTDYTAAILNLDTGELIGGIRGKGFVAGKVRSILNNR